MLGWIKITEFGGTLLKSVSTVEVNGNQLYFESFCFTVNFFKIVLD